MTEHDARPATLAPARFPLGGAVKPMVAGRWATVLRLAAHFAAWLPFVIGAFRSAQQMLPSLGDGAAIAVRSWDALTPYGPLVGQGTALRNGAFDPGPLQYWLLAIPVHMDPRQGLVWGAALWCMIASSVAIEAARSAFGAFGGLAAAGCILATVAWQPLIAAHPYWNPWFGMIFFLAALAAALAVISGRRRWWPVLVVTASVAAQAHLMFLLASAALVLVALVTVLIDTVRARAGYWWVAIGLLAGAGCWAAPLIQQFTSPYPNMSLLLESLGRTPGAGTAFGFRALGASAWHPLWWTPSLTLARHSLAANVGGGSLAFGLVALALTAVTLAVAVRPLRSRRLAALAVVSLLASGAVLATYAGIPAHNLDNNTLTYLLIVLLPAGLLVWLTLGSAVVLAARRLAGPARALAAVRIRPRGEPGTPGGSGARWIVAAIGGMAIVLLGLGAWLPVAQQAGVAQHVVAPLEASAARQAARDIERMVAGQRIALLVKAPGVGYVRSVTFGVAWALIADGYAPAVNHRAARYLGPRYRYAGRSMPLLIVGLRPRGVVVTLTEASLARLG